MRAEGLKYVEFYFYIHPSIEKNFATAKFLCDCVIISNIWHAQNRTQGRKDVPKCSGISKPCANTEPKIIVSQTVILK